MSEPPPGYSCQQYERPSQDWVCGLAGMGPACAAGPSAHGKCPALGECAPARDGDRWQCNRSTVRGGPCDEGPTPDGACGRVLQCHPLRSLRAKRGRFVTVVTVFTAAALAITLSADWRDTAISPGQLSQPHGQLMAQDGAGTNCAACHSAARRSVGGWMAAAFVSHRSTATQSELCLNCHERTTPRDLALLAHNVPIQTLAEITKRRGGKPGTTDNLVCAACHREHLGTDHDLSAIDNAACQACHQQRYDSFATNHPDFGAWPYERRTRIAFNHASHQVKHFSAQGQAFNCQLCHVEDSSRRTELLVGYEAACANCHDAKIATSVARGVPMFVLPTLDIDALAAAGHEIGPWPAAATGDFDGRLPPVMKLLLAADPATAKAIEDLGADFEFLDVDPADSRQLAACAILAAEIKELLADLSRRGPVVVRERLSTVLDRPVSKEQLDALVAGMSVDTVRGANANWFPAADAGKASWSYPSEPAKPPGSAPSYGPAGAWSRDDATLSIRYLPVTHADPVLASWLALIVETPRVESRPLESAILKELSKPTAAGLCTSCHSIDAAANRILAINWTAFHGQTSRGFTKFQHRPHLLLPQLSDCSACHSIDNSVVNAEATPNRNPFALASEFRPISKRQCAECHTAAAAGDACQSCHNYHVEATVDLRPASGHQSPENLDSALRPRAADSR